MLPREESRATQKSSSELLKAKIAALGGENRTLKERLAGLKSELERNTAKITAICQMRELKLQLKERSQQISRLQLVLGPSRPHITAPTFQRATSPRVKSEVSSPKSPLWAEIKSALDKDLSPRSPEVQQRVQTVWQHVYRPARSMSQASFRSGDSTLRYQQLLAKEPPLAVVPEQRGRGKR